MRALLVVVAVLSLGGCGGDSAQVEALQKEVASLREQLALTNEKLEQAIDTAYLFRERTNRRLGGVERSLPRAYLAPKPE